MVLLFNRGELASDFVLPGTKACTWSLAFDTSTNPSFAADIIPIHGGEEFRVNGHSLICLRLNSGILGLAAAC